MNKYLSTLLIAFMCSLIAVSQSLIRQTPPRGNHHTLRLPGVNERRLARLEKMRETNVAQRHQVGPLRAKAQPETRRGLVLLVQFSDVKMKSNAFNLWNNRFNQQGFSLDNHVGSVRDYFIEQSYGLLTIDFDVIGPLALSKSRTYYGSAPNSTLDDRAPEMVIEALKLANPQVNYADYDWDGDGEVDQVYVIFAGETKSDVSGYIWPHEWDLTSAKYYGNGSGKQWLDGVGINTYAVSNELASSAVLDGIGTSCHEFSHCLGYPDFYDTEYSGGAGGQYWDLLDGGCYNGPYGIGEIPCPYTAYERWMAGWIDLIPLTEPCKVTDMPAINEQGVAYVIKNTGNVNEYYILENRQQKTFGTGNGGHGLMVWHIDYNKTIWENNVVNIDKNHQRMTFLPADGKVGDLWGSAYEGYYYSVTASDEAGDPYPGKMKVTSVQQLPWFTSEKGGTKKHQNLIHDISETPDGKISFVYGDYSSLPAPELAQPTNITEDSFTANWFAVSGATNYTLQVEAMTGEPGLATLLAEDFSGFVNASVSSIVSNSIVDRFTQSQGWSVSNVYGTKEASARVGSANSVGYIITPVINNAEGTLTVEFDASYYNTDGSSVAVSVLCGGTTVASETVSLTSKRATYTCTFENVPSGCSVKFATTTRSKRFYIYNVNVMDMSGTGSRVTTIKDIASTSYRFMLESPDYCYYRVQAVSGNDHSEWSDWMDVDVAGAIDAIGEVPINETSDITVFDLAGHRLLHTPKRGIYIRGGKTYMAE